MLCEYFSIPGKDFTFMIYPHMHVPVCLIGHTDVSRHFYPSPLRKWIFVLVSLLMLNLLSGCAGYHARSLSPRDGAEKIQNRILDREALKKAFPALYDSDTSDRTAWNLSELTLEAYIYNANLAAAKAQWARQKGEVLTEKELPNPELSVSPGYNATTDSGTIPSWIIGSALDFPVLFPGKRAARIERARFLNDAARLNFISVAWDIRSSVRMAYLNLFAAQKEHDILLKEQSTLDEKQKLFGKLVGIGEIAPQELTNIRAVCNEISLALAESDERVRLARAECADAIGVSFAALESVEFSFREFDGPLPEIPTSDVRHGALLNNTRLLGTLAEYEAARKELELAVREKYPDLRVGPGYEYDQGDNKWSLGVSLGLPVFNRHAGRIASAEGACAEKVAAFDGIQTRIINSSESAVSGYEALRKNVLTAEAFVGNISSLVEQQQALYNIGELSSLDLIDGRLRIIAAERYRLSVYVRAYELIGDIEDTTQLPCIGGSWDLETLQSSITGDTQ